MQRQAAFAGRAEPQGSVHTAHDSDYKLHVTSLLCRVHQRKLEISYLCPAYQ